MNINLARQGAREIRAKYALFMYEICLVVVPKPFNQFTVTLVIGHSKGTCDGPKQVGSGGGSLESSRHADEEGLL